MMIPRKVIVRGAGDLATGVAHRLWTSGFFVVMLELPDPLVVRRTVSFAIAVYENSITVENVTAKLCPQPEQVDSYIEKNLIPVVVDPDGSMLLQEKHPILIDAIMSKNNTLTSINQAELVIGLGPGFTASRDVDAVVETERGHNLGKVIYSGQAATDTGKPGEINGFSTERLLKAPHGGIFKPNKNIGDLVKAGDIIAEINSTEIKTTIDGMIRGMLYPGIRVEGGTKVGDIDPRGNKIDYMSISDKARSVGGGVLEAILSRYYRKM